MLVRPEIYLDSNAGMPLRPEVSDALRRLLSTPLVGRGTPLPNPSSVHSHGRKAKKLLNQSREKIAHSFGPHVLPEEILLTSSGTEANQTAIRSALAPALERGERVHWITTRVEHDATLKMTTELKAQGVEVSFLPVDEQGRPRISLLGELVQPSTRLISAIWVNNETGVFTDVMALTQEASRLGVPVHLDAAQAWGKVPLDLSACGATWVSFSGHKIGALSGTGVLWRRKGAPLRALIPGQQELGLRGGTENLLGIVSLGAAAEALSPIEWETALLPMRKRWEERILRIPGAILNGAEATRIANTMNFSFEGVERADLVAALDLQGFSVSSGSACSSGVSEPSHVLLAMGRSPGMAGSSIRISFFEELSDEVLASFSKALEECLEKVRKSSN